MENNGILEEIRALLSQGQPSGEVIALGFKPSTVYKAQRQLKRKGSSYVSNQEDPPSATGDTGPRPELKAENIKLVENLRARLECVIESGAELATEVQSIRGRVATVELESKTIAQSRQTVIHLEGQIESLTRGQAIQEKRFALSEEQWAELEPAITAMCTQFDCLDQQGKVVLHQPEHLQRRSEEALETIRSLSRYKGEKAEQNEFVQALALKALSSSPPLRGLPHQWH